MSTVRVVLRLLAVVTIAGVGLAACGSSPATVTVSSKQYGLCEITWELLRHPDHHALANPVLRSIARSSQLAAYGRAYERWNTLFMNQQFNDPSTAAVGAAEQRVVSACHAFLPLVDEVVRLSKG